MSVLCRRSQCDVFRRGLRCGFNRGLGLVVGVALLGSACATTPAVPPSKDSIQTTVRADGADQAYKKYAVDVTGNVFLGHEVVVGGVPDNKSPARMYFNKAAFDVDHLNSLASLAGTILLITGSAITSVSAILIAVNVSPYVPISLLCGCALPTMLCSLGFTYWSGWNMDEAGDDYNTKLRAMIDEAATRSGAPPITSTDNVTETGGASSPGGSDSTTGGQGQADPQPDTEMAPFEY